MARVCGARNVAACACMTWISGATRSPCATAKAARISRQWADGSGQRNGQPKQEKNMSRGFKDLRVYQLAYQLAMRIFHESKRFPPEERYSLTDQIRRASRSVSGNVAEGYRKRRYPNAFASKMADADGEGAETQGWIDYGRDCGYWSAE